MWSVPTEAEVAAALEKKYLDATKDFVKLKKNDELMFCKRYREIGTTIAKINCLTASQVRVQVDNMDKYRDDMRNKSGKCTFGAGTATLPAVRVNDHGSARGAHGFGLLVIRVRVRATARFRQRGVRRGHLAGSRHAASDRSTDC